METAEVLHCLYGFGQGMIDNVDHPTHYSRWEMEAIEFIAVNNLPWWLANVLKYCIRYDAKDGLQDLYKARSYLEMKIRQLEKVPRFWEKPVREQRSLAGSITKVDAVYTPSFCYCGMRTTDAGYCWDDDCVHKKALKP